MGEPLILAHARERRAAAVEATRPLAEAMSAPAEAPAPEPIPDEYRITAPGVYDVPAEIYHRDPVAAGSLSSTGARKLVEPGGPARYRWEADHPEDRRRSDALDFGVLAHQLVLGDPDDRIVLIPADEWRTDAIKADVAKARAAGKVPVKPAQLAVARAMADGIRANATAEGLLRATAGHPEKTIVWVDDRTGVWCRARVDWLRTKVAGRTLLLVDYKTAAAADAEAFARSAADYGYHQQAEWYTAGVRALGIDDAPAFIFIVQEKKPPYLVHAVELDHVAMVIGRNLNHQARSVFADASRTGVWPGYGDEVTQIELPHWYRRQYDED